MCRRSYDFRRVWYGATNGRIPHSAEIELLKCQRDDDEDDNNANEPAQPKHSVSIRTDGDTLTQPSRITLAGRTTIHPRIDLAIRTVSQLRSSIRSPVHLCKCLSF